MRSGVAIVLRARATSDHSIRPTEPHYARITLLLVEAVRYSNDQDGQGLMAWIAFETFL